MAQTSQIFASNARLLRTSASKYAVYGVLVALSAILAATLLVSYVQSGQISLDGIMQAQKSNAALWLLDVMPFAFAIWGQYVSSILAYEAGAMVIDQTNELRAQATALEHQATHGTTHDVLTDLPNRALLHDRVEQALNAAQSEKNQLALLLLDLNQFKEINNTLGHYNGDLLLKQVAMRLRGVIREPDSVARTGGNEFAILLPKISTIDDAVLVARKIHKALESSFSLEKGLSLGVQVGIGVAMFPEHGTDADTLLQRAHVAMHVAKQDKSSLVIYDTKLDQFSPQRLTLMGELRYAIEHDELLLHYQPKFDIKTRSVTGVEALVRWQHQRHNLMYPNDFIPLAERTGLIKPLTQWVLNHALQQLHTWHKKGCKINIAVNLPAQDLLNLELPDIIAGVLAAHEADAGQLVLEITESAIMEDHTRALQILTRLAEMGVRLSIDDFGTGYSSLSYLSKLPVSEIKIDQSFVRTMGENKQDAMIVRATIDLAHNLGLKVIAEGVENQETFAQLEALGCDAIQGYYITRGLAAAEFDSWMSTSSWSGRKA